MSKKAKTKHGVLAKKEPMTAGLWGDAFHLHPFRADFPSLLFGKPNIWKPEVDVYETEKDVIVKANVPGCDKKDVKVHLSHNILMIHGEKKEDKEIKKGNFYQKEHRFGSFSRSISLPHYVNAAKARATCERGVLRIIFPRMKTAISRSANIIVK